jgi:hypothetical protein
MKQKPDVQKFTGASREPLCFRKLTQEIFSELDETKARRLEIYQSFQRTEEEMERSHWWATPPGGAA